MRYCIPASNMGDETGLPLLGTSASQSKVSSAFTMFVGKATMVIAQTNANARIVFILFIFIPFRFILKPIFKNARIFVIEESSSLKLALCCFHEWIRSLRIKFEHNPLFLYVQSQSLYQPCTRSTWLPILIRLFHKENYAYGRRQERQKLRRTSN